MSKSATFDFNSPQYVDFTNFEAFDFKDGADVIFDQYVVGEGIELDQQISLLQDMNNLAINMKSKESFQKCTKQKIERVKDIEFRPASVILSAVDCPFCKVAVLKSEFKEHLILYHSMFKTMTCPICDESVSGQEWDEHIDKCKEALVATKNHITELENQLKAQFQCPICLGEVTQNDAKAPQCGHVMHATCEDRLPKTIIGDKPYITCPTCRQFSHTIKLY